MPWPLAIAVDGPAGVGKGTLARRLAAEFGLPHLDTGLLYRAVGRRVLDGGGDPAVPAVATGAARALTPEDLRRDDLRGPAADAAASKVAVVPGVRAALLEFQRVFATGRGAVLDGRDIGTVVLPHATAKLFVTALPAERARRRWLERTARGEAVSLEAVAADMAERDARDAGRGIAPMRPAEDAVVIDTTGLDADAVFAAALEAVGARLR